MFRGVKAVGIADKQHQQDGAEVGSHEELHGDALELYEHRVGVYDRLLCSNRRRFSSADKLL